MEIRQGGAQDNRLLATFFRQMWLDNGIAASDIRPDWEARTIDFVEYGREHHALEVFFASIEGVDVGSAVCQRFSGLYPDILSSQHRLYGYVWGVYVVAEKRRLGIGAQLTQRCCEQLEAIGCTHAILHAAPMGQGVYDRLGFRSTNEMRRPLEPVVVNVHTALENLA